MLPYTPGGSIDLIARTLAVKLAENLGQQRQMAKGVKASGAKID